MKKLESSKFLQTGANDVWTVKPEKGKKHYIPYIEDVVKEIDIEEKKIIIHVWKVYYHDENSYSMLISRNVYEVFLIHRF